MGEEEGERNMWNMVKRESGGCSGRCNSLTFTCLAETMHKHTHAGEREHRRRRKKGRAEDRGDKEVSVGENMESDIKVRQFNLLASEPKMHG